MTTGRVTKQQFRVYKLIIYGFPGIFLLSGLIFSAVGVHEYLRSKKWDTQTTGLVTSYEDSTTGSGRTSRHVRAAIVTFTVGDKTYVFEGENHTTRRFPYKLGQAVDIKYQSGNPANAHIADESTLSSFIFIGFPLTLFFGGVIIYFAYKMHNYHPTIIPSTRR